MKANSMFPKTFKWSGPHDGCGGSRWCCDHKDLQGLDVTEIKPVAGEVEKVSISTRSDELSAVCDGIYGIAFETKDEAASIVLSLLTAHRKAVAKAPVPKEQVDFISRQLDDNRRQAQALRDMCWANRSQMRELRATAKALGLARNLPSHDESDVEKLIATIDNFKLDFDGPKDPPFFSEAKLYDMLGKDQARSVLGLMDQIKRALDPIAAAE